MKCNSLKLNQTAMIWCQNMCLVVVVMLMKMIPNTKFIKNKTCENECCL